MNILLITDAIAPLSGRSARAQVAGALPKALKSLDHQPFVLSPLYKSIDPKEHSLARRLTKLKHNFAGADWACELWTGRTVGGAELIFIGHEELFHSTEAIDAGDEATIAKRVGAFVRSAVVLLEKNEQELDAIHAHGWLGAAVLVAAKNAGLPFRRVLTVHDTTDNPIFSAKQADILGLGTTGETNPLALGLAAADIVNVASDSTDLKSLGFDGEAQTIRSGVDSATWNPLTDPHIPARFDPIDVDGKVECKAHLQIELDFPERAEVPLLVAVGQEGSRDGLDLLAKCASEILRNDVQLLVIVEGAVSDAFSAVFSELQTRWPDRLQFRSNVDTKLLHSAIAGADLALLPSPSAATAERALIAQRYGSVPVARRQGAFAEAIVDCDAKLTTGNGILFDDGSAEGVLAGARRGIAAFAETEAFAALRSRVMRVDATWDRSARLYERLYTPPKAPVEDAVEDASADA